MIVRNQAVCRECGEHIMSYYRWDYRACRCGKSAVDGGTDYLRRMGRPRDTSIVVPDDVGVDMARIFLGILCAIARLGDGYHTPASVLASCRKQQRTERPEFHAPEDVDELLLELRELDEFGLVETDGAGWRNVCEIAPWDPR